MSNRVQAPNPFLSILCTDFQYFYAFRFWSGCDEFHFCCAWTYIVSLNWQHMCVFVLCRKHFKTYILSSSPRTMASPACGLVNFCLLIYRVFCPVLYFYWFYMDWSNWWNYHPTVVIHAFVFLYFVWWVFACCQTSEDLCPNRDLNVTMFNDQHGFCSL